MKVFEIDRTNIQVGAKVENFMLSSGTAIPAIVVGESGRGRKLGVLPVQSPASVPCPNTGVKKTRWVADNEVECEICKIKYAVNTKDSDGNFYGLHPESSVYDTLKDAVLGTTRSGGHKLVNASESSNEFAVVVLRTHIGFRGSNEITGDRTWRKIPCKMSGVIGRWWEQGNGTCPHCGTRAVCAKYSENPGLEQRAKDAGYDMGSCTFMHPDTEIIAEEYLPFKGTILANGIIAQGDAGRAGSGYQHIAVVRKNDVFRTGYHGRLYGAESEHYYRFDGQRIIVQTWAERMLEDEVMP